MDLPPTKRTRPYSEGPDAHDPKFDRTKYDAIGESDRMTLKFRKPQRRKINDGQWQEGLRQEGIHRKACGSQREA